MIVHYQSTPEGDESLCGSDAPEDENTSDCGKVTCEVCLNQHVRDLLMDDRAIDLEVA